MRHAPVLLGVLLACGCSEKAETAATGSDTAPTGGETETETDTDTEVDCSERPLEVAPPRGEGQGVWDAEGGRMVFFGGDQGQPDNCITQTDIIGDTWAFHVDCNNFEQISVGEGPSARARHAVVHDVDGNRMIVHGGRYRAGTSGDYTVLDDVWSFDLATDTWTQLSAGGGAPGRHSHAAWVVEGVLYVYGGNESTDGLYYLPRTDLWAFDLEAGSWTELTPTNEGPGSRIFPAVAMEEDGSALYLYGGTADFFGPTWGDLWSLDLGGPTWTELDSGASGPVARFGAHLVHDPDGDRLLMWAGHDTTDLGNTNQLWSYDLDGGQWLELSEGDVLDQGSNGFCDFPADFTAPDLGAPERRYLGAAVNAGGQMLIFGGKTDCGIINDVWGWSLADGGWTEHSAATSGEICLRAFAECESLCF